ncbi:unnamed protein product [Phytophthora fragariaefolia]|uniref:Unnamed protein product n=1 Tax=Phytophthora fragariaefolia TaxID=1490495 RepID=A0A9W6U528_9STRA|nr:unnamed protein product [Phytophthora fragariaefolia]
MLNFDRSVFNVITNEVHPEINVLGTWGVSAVAYHADRSLVINEDVSSASDSDRHLFENLPHPQHLLYSYGKSHAFGFD